MKSLFMKSGVVLLVVSILLPGLILSACSPRSDDASIEGAPLRLPGPYISGKEALQTINALRTEAVNFGAHLDSYWQADTFQKLLSINPEGWGLYALGVWYNSTTKESLRIHKDGTIRYVGPNGHIKVLWFNSETQKVHDLADLRVSEGEQKKGSYKEEDSEAKPVKGLDRFIICGEVMGGVGAKATGAGEPRKPGEKTDEDFNNVMQQILDFMETMIAITSSQEWWATESFPGDLPDTPTDRAMQLDSWLRSATDPTRKERRLIPGIEQVAEGETEVVYSIITSESGGDIEYSWEQEGKKVVANSTVETYQEVGETETHVHVSIKVDGKLKIEGDYVIDSAGSWGMRITVYDEEGGKPKITSTSSHVPPKKPPESKSKPRPDGGADDIPSEEAISMAFELFKRYPIRIIKDAVTNPDPTESSKRAYTALTGKLIHEIFGAVDPGPEGGEDLPSKSDFLDCIHNMNLNRDPGWVDPAPMYEPTTSREMRALGRSGLFGMTNIEHGTSADDLDDGRGRPGLHDTEHASEPTPTEMDEHEVSTADSEGPALSSMVNTPDPIYIRGNNPDQANVITSINDPSGISRVTLMYRYQGASRWAELPMNYLGANNYSGRLGPFDYVGSIEYRVAAWDTQGYMTESGIGTVTVVTPPQLRLTIQINGSGSTLPSQGTYHYSSGTVVNISAYPSPDWEFVNWSGAVSNTSLPDTTVIIDSDKTITANFTARPSQDTTGPTISNINDFPDPIYTSGTKPDQATVSATVTDPSGVSKVFLENSYQNSSYWASRPMTPKAGNVYTTTVGPLSKAGLISYRIRATDTLNNVSLSGMGNITVTIP